MNRDAQAWPPRSRVPLRPAQLALLVHGYLIWFLELVLLLGARRPGSGGFEAVLPAATLIHSLFALLLLVDAAAACRAARGGRCASPPRPLLPSACSPRCSAASIRLRRCPRRSRTAFRRRC